MHRNNVHSQNSSVNEALLYVDKTAVFRRRDESSSHSQKDRSLEIHGEIQSLIASLIVSVSRFRRGLDAVHGLKTDKCVSCRLV